eukprot:2629522-Pleurochrysis_carterae.AAC.2
MAVLRVWAAVDTELVRGEAIVQNISSSSESSSLRRACTWANPPRAGHVWTVAELNEHPLSRFRFDARHEREVRPHALAVSGDWRTTCIYRHISWNGTHQGQAED